MISWMLAVCLLLTVAFAEPVPLIIDTDMSTDVDDAIALALALKLEEVGEARLLAVVHNTGLPSAAGAVSVITHYYGRDDVPIGAYKGSFGDPSTSEPLDATDPSKTVAGPYVEELVQNFSSPIRDYSQVPEALEVYRRVLSEASDHSVVISSIGFLINLDALLRSSPDVYSPLRGVDLVERKVKLLSLMGGAYPQSIGVMRDDYEWNLGGGCAWGARSCPTSRQASAFVLDNWPSSVPLRFSGFEAGSQVLTGQPFAAGDAAACPGIAGPVGAAFRSYAPWNSDYPGRMSWDPLTTLYAVRGAGDFYDLHVGRNSFNVTDGSNKWVNDAKEPGSQAYEVLRSEDKALELKDIVNVLACEFPNPTIVSVGI